MKVNIELGPISLKAGATPPTKLVARSLSSTNPPEDWDPADAARALVSRKRRGRTPALDQTASPSSSLFGFMSPFSQVASDSFPNTVYWNESSELDWRSAVLDEQTLDRYPPEQLLRLLADISPEVSKALWDFLRFCNPGWECVALRSTSPASHGNAPYGRSVTEGDRATTKSPRGNKAPLDSPQAPTAVQEAEQKASDAKGNGLTTISGGYQYPSPAPGRRGGSIHRQGQARLREFFNTLDDYNGTIDVLFGRMFFSAWLHGSFLNELVLDPSSSKMVDLTAPSPRLIAFRRKRDPERGGAYTWQLGQILPGGSPGAAGSDPSNFVPIDTPLVRYVPVDPADDSPYGRPLASPALFSAIFLMAVLHDLRRVIQQQGYPRMDVEINLEAMRDSMPSLAQDPKKFREWAKALITEVETGLAGLQPEDTYVHTSVVKVNRPVAPTEGNSLRGITDVLNQVSLQLVRALKSQPILLGVALPGGEQHANRQWEAHLLGIETLQHYAETSLERLLQKGLQAEGIVAEVRFRFSSNRASEALRDAQTQQFEIDNAMTEYWQGLITQEEFAMKVTGHSPALTEPIAVPRSYVLMEEVKVAIAASKIVPNGGPAPNNAQDPQGKQVGTPGTGEGKSQSKDSTSKPGTTARPSSQDKTKDGTPVDKQGDQAKAGRSAQPSEDEQERIEGGQEGREVEWDNPDVFYAPLPDVNERIESRFSRPLHRR